MTPVLARSLRAPRGNAEYGRRVACAIAMMAVLFSVPVFAQKGKKPNQPPNVSISSPSDGAIYTAPASITITANANDPDGSIPQVDFYANGVWIGSDTKKPYTTTWTDVSASTYTVTAIARDNSGATQTSSPKSIIVNAAVAALPPPDTTPPTVSITSPANGASVTGTVAVSTSASDNVGIASVSIVVDGVSVGSDTSSPYTVSWNSASVAPGSHTLRAEARDPAGNIGTSSSITITVLAPNQAPTISMTAPASGASYTASSSITVSANATDPDGAIARVDFYVGTALIASDTTSPYSVTWSTSTAGTYSFSATAVDSKGATATSSAVSASVTSAAPSTAHFSPSADDAAVQTYRLDIFLSTATVATAAPTSSKDLGKPALMNGEYVADISSTLAALPTGSYVATVSAVSGSGSARSAPSSVFSVTAAVTTTALGPAGAREWSSALAEPESTGASSMGARDVVWASNSATGIVAAFDATSGDVLGTVGVGLAPSGIAAPHGARAVYVANEGSDTVSVIDKAAIGVVATIGLPAPSGRRPRFASSSPDGSAVYIGEAGSNVVDVIDTASNRIALRFAGGQPGSTIRGAVTNSTGEVLYTISAGDQSALNTFAAIEAATGRWLWTIALDDQPVGLTVTSDDRVALIAVPATNGIRAIDLSQRAVSGDVDLGAGNVPDAIQLADDGQVVVTLRPERQGVAIVDSRGVRMVSAQSSATRWVAQDAQHLSYVGGSLGTGEASAVLAVDPARAAIVFRFQFPGGGVVQTAVLDPR